MNKVMFDSYIEEISDLADNRWQTRSRILPCRNDMRWPKADGQIILGSDTAVELGSPQTVSVSFFLWTEDLEKIKDRTITVVGPELCETDQKQLPFGKIVLLGGHGFSEENSYSRYQEINRIRFQMSLSGYMMRAVLQEGKEWSRVGTEAMQRGFSLQVLGSELIREFQSLDYIDKAAVIFVTSSAQDVMELKPIGDKVNKTMRAMNKIYENLEYDCAACDFSDVCNEVEGLRKIHKKMSSGTVKKI